MASEVARMPRLSPSHTMNKSVLNFGDFQVSGVDVPRQGFPYCTSKPSYFQPDYACSGFTPPNVWTDASLCQAVGSSACSTETESNDDDDFMADLAEQMAHFMLENDEEEEVDPTVSLDNPSSCSSKWMPLSTNSTSPDAKDRSLRLHSRQWPGSQTCPVDCQYLSTSSGMRPPLATKESYLDRFPCKVATKSSCFKTEKFREKVSSHLLKQQESHQAMSRKIEEFLWKQALKQSSHINNPFVKDSSAIMCELASGSVMPTVTKPKYSSYNRSQRSCKLSDDEKRMFSNQCRQPRQGTCSLGRNGRQQQQGSPALLGRTSVHSRKSDAQRYVRMSEPASAWQVASNLNGNSNMRAVFLGGNASGRESAGTGVFLPRTGISHDNKRKPVLLPSRIVQVLNLQVHDPTPQQCRPPPYFLSSSGSLMMNSVASVTRNMEVYQQHDYIKSYTVSHAEQPSQGFKPPQGGEFNLPLDWTY